MTHRSKRLFPVFLIFSGIILFSIKKAFPKNSVADGGKLSIGIWQGLITRKDGNTIPFNFQTSESGGKFSIYVINGSERLLVDNIRQKGDSLFIEMPFFDSHFVLRILGSQKLEGNWIKNYGDRQVAVPFQAVFNVKERYPDSKPPAFNISGRWSVHFKGLTDTTEAVGEFTQTGSHVRGTFLTISGDYRFLEGVVSGDTLKLSTFDGGHAYSFVSRILSDKKMIEGFYYAGATSVETWVAEKNEQAKLPDEFSQTALTDSTVTSLHFKFYDLNGHLVSVNDPKFKNKVVIVQILGSWCPNCMDETQFMSSYYIQNRSRGVEVLGLAYERTTSPSDARRLLHPFVTRFNVTYPILITGVAVNDTLRAEKTIPEIREIVGFPTTIFIDKKGTIRKIHTGFNGPGTGVHYEMYKKEFNELVNTLLRE